ncbi:Hsp20/alpha crystallin family protein [Magnetococcus sp. PR-3]|uniref:Hsp20/alpha crystallin family protein n=1 Tax=Magnetococcus sp. PR-3 TaxID=3120355 RepID=UPI002FCE1AFA
MTLMTLDPFRQVRAIQKEMDHLMARAAQDAESVESTRTPLISLHEDEKAWIVEAEMPGIDIATLKVENQQRTVSFFGALKTQNERDHTNCTYDERANLPYQRHLKLPGDVENGKATASYAQGMLTIVCPKASSNSKHQVPVQTFEA